MHDTCIVPAIILQKKTQTNVDRFTLTTKLNTISENLSFLLWACVHNEVTGIHKFNQHEILFIGTFCVSFSYELRARKSLNWFKLQGSEKLEVTLFFVWPPWSLGQRGKKPYPVQQEGPCIGHIRELTPPQGVVQVRWKTLGIRLS